MKELKKYLKKGKEIYLLSFDKNGVLQCNLYKGDENDLEIMEIDEEDDCLEVWVK